MTFPFGLKSPGCLNIGVLTSSGPLPTQRQAAIKTLLIFPTNPLLTQNSVAMNQRTRAHRRFLLLRTVAQLIYLQFFRIIR